MRTAEDWAHVFAVAWGHPQREKVRAVAMSILESIQMETAQSVLETAKAEAIDELQKWADSGDELLPLTHAIKRLEALEARHLVLLAARRQARQRGLDTQKAD